MKITILDLQPDEEEEVIIKCHEISDDLNNLIQKLKQGNTKMMGYRPEGIYLMDHGEIYYVETVDTRVYAYCKQEVYEVREKLYELERELPVAFMRASKSTIINLDKVKSLSPAFGGRFEAVLDNGEKTIISRQYVSVLKERLGL